MAAGDKRGYAFFQVAVRGLLELLRIKGGVGPNELALCVDPVIDVTDFYGSECTVLTADNLAPGAITAGGSGSVSTHPRRYLAMQGQIVMGAAAGTFLRIHIGFSWQGQSQILASATFTPIAGQRFAVSTNVIRLILPPSAFVQMQVDGDAAGADHVVQLRYTYQRLDGLP